LAGARNRSSRIRDLKAKPDGIKAKTSERKIDVQAVESAINAWDLLVFGLKAT